MRERARIEDRLLAERLDTLALPLMREARVDMWILIAREYPDDEVLQTMLDAENFTARRRTILSLSDPCPPRAATLPVHCAAGTPEADTLERLTVSRAVSRYGLGGLFRPARDPDKHPDQWNRLGRLVADRAPRRIAINTSADSAFADGLTHSQYQALKASLPAPYADRLVCANELAIHWLETRMPSEMALYPMIVRTAHAIMAEGLSTRAITAGTTTVADLEWWLRERIAELKLETWFHPGIAIVRRGEPGELAGDTVFQPRDLVWLDFGITCPGLNTDTQHLAYILKPGETDAPAGLKAGLAAANRVPEWNNQRVQFRTEEDAFFDGKKVRYSDGRQTQLILIEP